MQICSSPPVFTNKRPCKKTISIGQHGSCKLASCGSCNPSLPPFPLPTPSSSSTCPGVRARVGFCRRHPGWSGYTPQRDHVSHMLVTSLVLVTTTHSFCDSTQQLPVTWRQAWSRSGHKICCVLPTHLATSTRVCRHASQPKQPVQYTLHLLASDMK